MKRLSITLVANVAALSTTAVAFAGTTSGSNWHVGYYTKSAHGTLSSSQASSAGLGSLNFNNQANTALLVTSQKTKTGNLIGDLTGKTLTATATISGATGAFKYYGEPDGCGTPANVRLYFETSNASGFAYTHWWSNPTSAALANGTLSLTATLNDPAMWSDWNGQSGTTESAGFAAAVSNVTTIGLSFGGGCFFENGVGTTDGSGTFVLNSYTAG
jgi:hypothetical protein